MYTLIVTGSDQKKRPLLSSDEFLTLESTICLEEHIVRLQNANLDSAAIEFSKIFKEAKEMEDDKVYELKLSVISDPLKETTYAQVSRWTSWLVENTSTIYAVYMLDLSIQLTNIRIVFLFHF